MPGQVSVQNDETSYTLISMQVGPPNPQMTCIAAVKAMHCHEIEMVKCDPPDPWRHRRDLKEAALSLQIANSSNKILLLNGRMPCLYSLNTLPLLAKSQMVLQVKDYPGLLRVVSWVFNGLELVVKRAK